MKILISGSRDYEHTEKVERFCSLLGPDDLVLVGDARGVDDIVYNYWKQYQSFKLERFEAAWTVNGVYNHRAGIQRNLEMFDKLPKLVVAFWTGDSPGTKFIIDTALKRHMELRVFFDL